MTIPVWKPARAEMLKRTAHFKNLKEVNTGVPDMEIDGYRDRKTAPRLPRGGFIRAELFSLNGGRFLFCTLAVSYWVSGVTN
jgi:hypothetical protein